MKVDVPLHVAGHDAAAAARALADAGFDGAFTFEGPNDVFLPLARAAGEADLDLYSNVAISFPRSPTHLAHTAWDLQGLSGGRFLLGLGSQVRAHVERRHGAEFVHPADRMADQVAAIKAIFEAWTTGGPLEHRGPFWSLDLMPPTFRPAAVEGGAPPVLVAAVGPRMLAAACREGDGVLLHPFNSQRFFEGSSLPAIEAGLAAAGRSDDDFLVAAGVIVALGADDAGVARAIDGARANIAFYGSTPAYRGVLDAEGAGDLQPALRDLTRANRWADLPTLVSDDLVRSVAICGTPAEVAQQLRVRFEGRADRIALSFPHIPDLETVAALAAELRS